MPIQPAIVGAQTKAAGIFPQDLARVLFSVSIPDWEVIRWYNGPMAEEFIFDLQELASSLLLSS